MKGCKEKSGIAKDNIFIEILKRDKDGKERVIETRKYKNIIVDNGAIFQARRFQPTGAIANGFQLISVGDDYGVGSLQDPEQPNGDEVELRNEIARKEIDSWEYLDPDSGEVSGNPTNVLQLHMEFDYGDAVGEIVEMGLFGGDADPQVADSGQLFAYRVFSVINKTAEIKFRAKWIITFKARS